MEVAGIREDTPDVVGRYRLGKQLAVGGMGVIHVAHDVLLRRDVAYKRLKVPHEAARPRVTALFEREYNALRQLKHPNIVEVYDYGLDALGPFYTMELLTGQDLASAAPLPLATACSILRDVASALALLHARRMVHRDVTPSNVRLTPEGRAKLIDCSRPPTSSRARTRSSGLMRRASACRTSVIAVSRSVPTSTASMVSYSRSRAGSRGPRSRCSAYARATSRWAPTTRWVYSRPARTWSGSPPWPPTRCGIATCASPTSPRSVDAPPRRYRSTSGSRRTPARICVRRSEWDAAFHAETLVRLNRAEEAKVVCERAIRLRTAQGAKPHSIRAPIQQLALVEAALGNPERAKELLRELMPHVLQTGILAAVAGVHRDLARVALVEKDVQAFDQHFAAMVASIRDIKNPALLQHCRRLLAEAEKRGVATAPSWEKHQLVAPVNTQDLASEIPDVTELIA